MLGSYRHSSRNLWNTEIPPSQRHRYFWRLQRETVSASSLYQVRMWSRFSCRLFRILDQDGFVLLLSDEHGGADQNVFVYSARRELFHLSSVENVG